MPVRNAIALPRTLFRVIYTETGSNGSSWRCVNNELKAQSSTFELYIHFIISNCLELNSNLRLSTFEVRMIEPLGRGRDVQVETVPEGPGRTNLKSGEILISFTVTKRPPG